MCLTLRADICCHTVLFLFSTTRQPPVTSHFLSSPVYTCTLLWTPCTYTLLYSCLWNTVALLSEYTSLMQLHVLLCVFRMLLYSFLFQLQAVVSFGSTLPLYLLVSRLNPLLFFPFLPSPNVSFLFTWRQMSYSNNASLALSGEFYLIYLIQYLPPVAKLVKNKAGKYLEKCISQGLKLFLWFILYYHVRFACSFFTSLPLPSLLVFFSPIISSVFSNYSSQLPLQSGPLADWSLLRRENEQGDFIMVADIR